MNALFIGGTGVISTSVAKEALTQGWDLTLLNRGSRPQDIPEGAHTVTLDVNDEQAVSEYLRGRHFDAVADFIAYGPAEAERDLRLFEGQTSQYIFISTASIYHKPVVYPVITEGTSRCNPYWEYSRKKILCEDLFMQAHQTRDFPVTIVRPSHTFAERTISVPIHGKYGCWQVIDRMRRGKRVLVPGDGTSLWAAMSSTDFASAFVGLMGNPHAIGEAVQITGEELMTWNQILKTEADILGAEYRPCYVPSDILARCTRYDLQGALLGDKSNTVIFDCSKLHRLVPQYRPRYRFEQAARISLEYLCSHPEYQKEDPEFDAFCDRVAELTDSFAQSVANA